jgi:anti-anti-sigma factor
MSVTQHLTIRRRDVGPRRTLAVRGDLDLATSGALADAVAQAGADGVAEIELDFRELEFIDLSGLRVIVLAREQCRDGGAQLLLVPSPRHGFRRLIELVDIAGALPWQDGPPPAEPAAHTSATTATTTAKPTPPGAPAPPPGQAGGT